MRTKYLARSGRKHATVVLEAINRAGKEPFLADIVEISGYCQAIVSAAVTFLRDCGYTAPMRGHYSLTERGKIAAGHPSRHATSPRRAPKGRTA